MAKEKMNVNDLEILNAYFISDTDTSVIRVLWLDREKNKTGKGNYSNNKSLGIVKKVYEIFTEEEILQNTRKIFRKQAEFNSAVQDYITARKTGNLNINTGISLKTIKTLALEDLFRIKLEIFEDEDVQNSDDKDLRSKLRKSDSLIELMHYYYLIKYPVDNNTNS